MKAFDISVKNNMDYSINIEKGFDGLKDSLEAFNPSKILIVSDSNVSELYMESLKASLKELNVSICDLVIKPGEASKDLNNYKACINFLCAKGFTRKDLIISLGGGVTGDLTGFAAATYMRGIRFINVPTTLLSMIDSSIGGKTAIDYKNVKNLIGSFYMPSLVYINVDTLNTLPEREFIAGIAEAMKAGLILDSKYYMWIIENMYEITDKEPEALSELIKSAISIKKTIVEKDPYEENERKLLNLGHTIGHALESYFDGEYNHGESVALGIVAASFISWKRGLMSMEEYYEIRDMFVFYKLPISISDVDYKKIHSLIAKDKKKTGKKTSMVLLKKIGKAILTDDVTDKEIDSALDELVFKDED